MNCLIAGVGGQGTVLASKLLAETALSVGLEARTSETIGMAQRGGSVVSHVRMGDGIHSPLIPMGQADVLIALEPAEAVRVLPYGKADCAVFLSDTPIQPSVGNAYGYDPMPLVDYLRRTVPHLTVLDGKAVARHCGSVRALNVAMLGAAVAGTNFPFTVEAVEAVLRRRIPAKYLEMNVKALHFQEGLN